MLFRTISLYFISSRIAQTPNHTALDCIDIHMLFYLASYKNFGQFKMALLGGYTGGLTGGIGAWASFAGASPPPCIPLSLLEDESLEYNGDKLISSSAVCSSPPSSAEDFIEPGSLSD